MSFLKNWNGLQLAHLGQWNGPLTLGCGPVYQRWGKIQLGAVFYSRVLLPCTSSLYIYIKIQENYVMLWILICMVIKIHFKFILKL
jgi:hypothetical protein